MHETSPNTQKHTPGPWSAAGASVLSPQGQVAQAFGPTLGESGPNARLIAAAPELYEALCDALPIVEDACEFMKDDFKPGVLSRIKTQIRAAIAKAEGSARV